MITLNELKPYFTQNKDGSLPNVCDDYSLNEGFEFFVNGDLYTRYEYNTIDQCWDLISDDAQNVITLVDEDEEIEDAWLERVERTTVLCSCGIVHSLVEFQAFVAGELK